MDTLDVIAGRDPAIQSEAVASEGAVLDGRPRGIAVRFNSAAISTSSSRKGALRALSGIRPQTKPEYWAGTPDKRQGAFRGDIEVWASAGKVKQTGEQCADATT